MAENKTNMLANIGGQVRAVKGRISSSYGVMVLAYLVSMALLLAVAVSLTGITDRDDPASADPPGMVHDTDVEYLGDNKYRVTWTYADDDGGLPITGHVVRDGENKVLAKVGGKTYEAVVTGRGIDTVSVCAVNAAGEGPQAAAHP